MVLTKKRVLTIFHLRVGDVAIKTKPMGRYVGMWMTRAELLCGDKTLEVSTGEAIEGVRQLMSDIGGPKSSRRRFLMTSVQSILLYGGLVWANALDHKRLSQGVLRVAKCLLFARAPSKRTW